MACKHCTSMAEYYAVREAQEQRCEEYSKGYSTETEEFYRDVETRVTFKDWLVERSGQRAYVHNT